MKRKTKKDRQNDMYSVGCVTLGIIKYFALIMTVAYIGAFIASGIVFMIKGSTLNVTTLAKLYSLITYYTSDKATHIIRLVGMSSAKVALLLYAFAYSIKYGIMYVLVSRFKEIFKSILKNKMFTDKNLDIIYSSMGLALVLAFAQPVIMGVNIVLTHVFLGFDSFDFSGILYLFVAVLLYMIFASGYNMERKHEAYDKELEEYRAEISELEIEKLKKKKDEKEIKVVETVVVEETKEVKEDKKVDEEKETTTAKKKRRRRKKTTKSSDKQ